MEVYWQRGLYASQSGLLTVVKAKIYIFRNLFIDLIAFAVQYVPIGTYVVGSVSSQLGLAPTLQIMVWSGSCQGSTFKAFLGSAWVRVPLSNKIRVRVGSVHHIYGSL